MTVKQINHAFPRALFLWLMDARPFRALFLWVRDGELNAPTRGDFVEITIRVCMLVFYTFVFYVMWWGTP